MDRIPIYTDFENLIEVFSMKRESADFIGMKQLFSKESILTFCLNKDEGMAHPLFADIAKQLASGDFIIRFLDDSESFLIPPFKTNLQHYFKNKSSIFFSNDTNRINISVDSNGLLLGGIGQEKDVYNKLNFSVDYFRGNKLLVIGDDFRNYNNLEPFILPFTEIIINEPYLFTPESKHFDLNKYLNNNFKPLIYSLFKNIKNKINIVIATFVDERSEHESPWYDLKSKSFSPLYDFLNDHIKEQLGGAKFKLWLIVSPMARKARHDRYIMTNYQYIESGAGLTYFDDSGNFINRGEAIHLYSIMHDDMRKKLMPTIIDRIQTGVINNVKSTHPNRIFGIINGNSHYLKFD